MSDLKRAVDSVLSGLTTTPDMQEALIRRAMSPAKRLSPRESSREAGERARVKLKLNFSLSFGLPHMVVAAIVIIVVMIAPLFVRHPELYSYQSEDEGWYITQGHKGEQGGAIAERKALPFGNYQYNTLEEALDFLGGNVPVPAWIPERFQTHSVMVDVMGNEEEFYRSLFWILVAPGEEGSIIYEWTLYSEPEFVMNYVEQTEAGEYVKLPDGRELYCSSNYQYESAVWIDGTEEYFIGGSLTREEAIRMAESVRIP